MKRNKYATLTIVVGLAAAVMLAQILVGQAPPQGQGGAAAGAPGQAPGGAPGGGGRGGAGGRGGGAPAVPAGPVVRTADGKPDFTGYWQSATKTNINSGRGGILNPETGAADGKIPYNPEWEAKAANETKNHMFNEPYTHCLPAGVPTNFGIQMGFQAVQDKNAIVFGWDTAGATRVIYLDPNRKHLPPSIKLYQGDSIGKFEGDVLTVETTNQMAGWWDANGAIHSDQVHVVEKFTFRDSNTIGYEAVVTDPVALTRPMTVTDTFRRNLNVPIGFRGRPTGYEQTETACVEGEQDLEKYPVSGGGYAKEGTPGANAPPDMVNTGGGGGRGGGGAPGGAPAGGAPGGAPAGGGGRGGGGRGGPGGAPGGAPPQQ
jgi:hypothetical protein